MKRGGPLKRDTSGAKEFANGPRTPLERGGPLAKRGKGYAVNRERNFGMKAEVIGKYPCDTCGASGPSDPSHYPSRGAGGTSKNLFPQCRPCHSRMHQQGVETFLAGIGKDTDWLRERTAYWERRWGWTMLARAT